MNDCEWISVEDRLPDLHARFLELRDEVIAYKASDPVLCVYDYDEQIVAGYEVDDGRGFWVDAYSGSELHSVTHWRPLPQLQKEAT